jgi:23S rRNA pseudouridine2605 synthase
MLERLQKIIARAGVASRRQAEKLILAGEVSVNGKIITQLGAKADAERDSIKVGAKRLRIAERRTYLLFHKPPECVSTMSDPEGRRSLRDFMHGVPSGVFPVGRLDYHASGAMLLTSDGELANQMLRAAESLPQTYYVKVRGSLGEDELRSLRQRTGARIALLKPGQNCWYEVAMGGAVSRSCGIGTHKPRGRSEALRGALTQMAHPLEKMKRMKLVNLELTSLPPGRYRPLTEEEVGELRRTVARAYRPRKTELADNRTPRNTPRRSPWRTCGRKQTTENS